MNLGEYIKDKISNFNREYFNPQFQAYNCLNDKNVKHEKRRYDAVSSNWSRINNNDDVQGCLNGVTSRVQQYTDIVEHDKALFPVDYFDVYVSMYLLIYALQKVASCYNNDQCDFHYVEGDIDQIFDTLEKITKQFNDIQMRNAYRD